MSESQLLSVMPIGWALNASATAAFVAAVLLAGLVALFWRFLASSKRIAFFAVDMVLAIIESNIRKLEDAIPASNTVVLNAHPIAVMTAATIRGEKGRQWPDHLYVLYDGLSRVRPRSATRA